MLATMLRTASTDSLDRRLALVAGAGRPAPGRPCRPCSASRPPSADHPRSPGCAGRGWCLRQSLHQRVVEVVGVGAQRVGRLRARSWRRCRNRTRRTLLRYAASPESTASRPRSATPNALAPTTSKLRRDDVGQRGDGDPQQQDGHGESTDGACGPRAFGVVSGGSTGSSTRWSLMPTCPGRRCIRSRCRSTSRP